VIVDARSLTAAGPAEADVCIIGAGPAGITLALELESAGRRVTLMEAGGLEFDAASQRLMEGETAGDAYPPLRDTRLAGLGGTTEVYAGYLRALDARDFEARPGSIGWPFGRDALVPFYRRAHEVCGLPPLEDEQTPSPDLANQGLLPAGDADVRNVTFHVNALGFGTRYRQRLAASRQIELVLHAPVMRLVPGEPGGRIAHVEVRTLDGHAFRARARHFVLAAGGIENARLLLLSGNRPDLAPGNSQDLVGRYFTEHPFIDPGWLVLEGTGLRLDRYFPRPAMGGGPAARVRWGWSLDRAVVDREGLQGGALLFYPLYEAHTAFATPEVKAFLEVMAKRSGKAVPGNAGRYMARALRAPHHVALAMLRKLLVGDRPARRWRLRAMFAAESRFENRVTLGSALDRLGRPCARVEWRLGERDLWSMRRWMQLVDQAVRRAGLGHVTLAFEDAPSAWRTAVSGGKHHMGTTRMHRDPAQGVVDENAKVHGIGNLFVAGSSVFPTSGYANPTLTIVALAIRLAEHIRQADTD
jgi:choline dehydrogenase-like flavoprotein